MIVRKPDNRAMVLIDHQTGTIADGRDSAARGDSPWNCTDFILQKKRARAFRTLARFIRSFGASYSETRPLLLSSHLAGKLEEDWEKNALSPSARTPSHVVPVIASVAADGSAPRPERAPRAAARRWAGTGSGGRGRPGPGAGPARARSRPVTATGMGRAPAPPRFRPGAGPVPAAGAVPCRCWVSSGRGELLPRP